MTWRDDIADCVIETAAGDRFVFEFRDLHNKRSERTAKFAFRTDGDYIQKTSSGSQQIGVSLWFSGALCLEMADSFEAATKDQRPFRFFHPIKKKPYLMQMLSIDRYDALATAAGEVRFDLDLHETIELEKQVKPENVKRFIDTTINYVKLISADQYGEAISKKTPGEIAKIKAALNKTIAKMATVVEAYDRVTDTIAGVQSVILTAQSMIETLETSASAFADLAFGVLRTIQNSILYVTDKVDFYRQLASDIANAEGALEDPATFKLINNAITVEQARTASLATEDDYPTKTQIFALADEITVAAAAFTAQLDTIEAAAIEAQVEELEPDTQTPTLIADVVTRATGQLAVIAYRAKQERTYTMPRDEEMYSLVYRLMGGDNPADLDAKIDRFIAANEIGGTELFELKKGRVVKYYV